MRYLLVGAALAVAGCGGETGPAFPALVPVRGVVKRSGAPVSGGVLKFTPDPDATEFSVNAEVGADGTFTVSTVRTTDRSGERKAGAPSGKYKVTYLPSLGDQTAGAAPKPIGLPMTTIAPGLNELSFELPKR